MNPISGIITDEQYNKLNELELFNHVAIRNFEIKRRYRLMRENGMRAEMALELLEKDYIKENISYETIRKICQSKK